MFMEKLQSTKEIEVMIDHSRYLNYKKRYSNKSNPISARANYIKCKLAQFY